MRISNKNSEEINNFIFSQIDAYSDNITKSVIAKYSVSRQAVNNRINNMIKNGIIEKRLNGKKFKYQLKDLFIQSYYLKMEDLTDENDVWIKFVYPHFSFLEL